MAFHDMPPFHPEEQWDSNRSHPHRIHDLHKVGPECDDQLAVFSGMGRGLRGDSYRIEIDEHDQDETYLKGKYLDAATNTWVDDWVSENINGGYLEVIMNQDDSTDPPTFTLTFNYYLPENKDDQTAIEWTQTTPAIPYLPETQEFPGAHSLFLKKTGDTWVTTNIPTSMTEAQAKSRQEKLLYPTNNRSDYNPPSPGDPWSVNLEYGIGGDLDAPNKEDAATILGITPQLVEDIVDGDGVIQGDGWSGTNIKEYIDNRPVGEMNEVSAQDLTDLGNRLDQDIADLNQDVEDLETHMHQDMGFPDGDLAGDGGTGPRNTIKKYIDGVVQDLSDHIHEDMGFNDILINDGDADTRNPKRNTIKKWFEWIIGQLGFGNDINDFNGDPNVTNIKQYIDYEIENSKEEIATPVLKVTTRSAAIKFFNVDNYTKAVNTKLIPGVVSDVTPDATITGTLRISYYDTLPMTEFSFEAGTGSGDMYQMPDECIGILFNSASDSTPLNLNSISLPGRSGNIKTPLTNPENLSNSGSVLQGGALENFQVYTGMGNCVSKNASSDAWPWGKSDDAYFYIFHRTTGSQGYPVWIDYARNYACSYNQAVPSS